MNLLMDLFLTFFKIGAFTFGGGFAMISMIENYVVEQKQWIDHDEMMNITVIAESTPGPIAINCATYVGYRKAGFAGALAATLGLVLPPFMIMYIIAMFLNDFLKLTIVANAFKGIKIAVGILIYDAGVKMVKKMHKKKFPRAVMFSSFVVMMLIHIFSWNFSSISLMLIAALFSLVVFLVKGAPASSTQKGGGAK